MIKQFLTFVVVFAAIGFAQIVPPKVSTQQMQYDFGTVPRGEHVKHSFVVSNVGGDLLEINDVRASCGCTAAKPEKDKLAPGESTNILVDFNSTGRSGKQTKIITVKTNDPDSPEIKFTLTGSVVDPDAQGNLENNPMMYFTETQHDFGTVQEGQVVDYTFNFVNKGETALQIRDVKTSCGCTAALVSKNTIEPGKEGTIKVELDTK
ncbi:MAG TPA: DUF1573 domain-containing protein, partial [Ignavibacteriaceae bacterium]|nr:DUF1573 domain-containing protein [Ignavibacteriaceae bacterium]